MRLHFLLLGYSFLCGGIVYAGYGPKYRHRSGQPPTLSPEVSDDAASAAHAPYTQLCAAEAAEA